MAKENKQKIGEMRLPTEELEKEYQESLEITEAEIQARAETETASENIDDVSEPGEEIDEQLYLSESEKKELQTQSTNVKPPTENPDYLEYAAEAVGYANRTEQWATYRTISNYFAEEDSVLDFGCGRGDFERFFKTEFRTDLDYIGIEMNQQLVEASKRAYNDEVDIRCMDWFDLPADVECDWSINIGSNNLRYDADTKRGDTQYMQDTVKTMMKHCKKGSIILLASDVAETEDGLTNWNPGDVLNWAQKEFGNVALDHSISNDVFILLIYKNEK